MASTIAAITTGVGGVVTTADATGNLSLLSGTTTVVAVTSTGASVTGTLAVSGAVTLTTTLAVLQGGTGVTTSTGSGNNVLSTSPNLTTPVLGTVTSGDISACTGTANSLNAGIGVNQTWTGVSASRAIGTTYTNSTGKPILVSMTFSCNTVNTVQGLTINGSTVYCTGVQVASQPAGFTLVVPNGATYVTVTNGGTLTKISWDELR
jgi:hypothetical protein